MSNSTLTSKGQTTIPHDVRRALGLRAGMRLTFEVNGETAILRPHPGAMAAFAALKSPSVKKTDFKAARAAALKSWAEEAAHEGTK